MYLSCYGRLASRNKRTDLHNLFFIGLCDPYLSLINDIQVDCIILRDKGLPTDNNISGDTNFKKGDINEEKKSDMEMWNSNNREIGSVGKLESIKLNFEYIECIWNKNIRKWGMIRDKKKRDGQFHVRKCFRILDSYTKSIFVGSVLDMEAFLTMELPKYEMETKILTQEN